MELQDSSHISGKREYNDIATPCNTFVRKTISKTQRYCCSVDTWSENRFFF